MDELWTTLPIYSAVRIHEDEDDPFAEETKPRTHRNDRLHEFKRKNTIGILLLFAWAASMMLGCCITGTIVRHNTWAEAYEEFDQWKASYRQELAEAEQAKYFQSGEASREAAINQEIDAVAGVIAKLSTDTQKLTEACCMLARVMNKYYPNSFREVAAQEQQWMFYDGTNIIYTEHDRELAEQIVRPYMESGIIPRGLTDQMVYGEWTPNDFILRDSYQTTSRMHTWRWSA